MKADYVHKDTLTATDYVELNKNNELLMSYNQALLKENQSLNKQLEEYKKWYQDELEENSKLSELWCDSRAKIRELENQQKVFINYLENMLDDENDIFSVVRVKDVLSKYKSILGEHNG